MHGLHDLGVADRRIGQQHRLDLLSVRRLVRLTRGEFVGDAQQEQHHGRGDRNRPQHGMENQIRPTKIGTHGASKNAVNPCVAMKF